MSKLYSKLAKVYHEMYQNIFDYEKEFQGFHEILTSYGSKKVLEIGCGSGNLAPLFLREQYSYVGLDLSNDMLDIAKKLAPQAKFVQGDMRNFDLNIKFDAILITGRSFSYLTTNTDIQHTLQSVYSSLKKGGVFLFDNFNAEQIISLKKKSFEQESVYNKTSYKRISTKTPNLEHGWTENWSAEYHIQEEGKKPQILKDESILRSFTKDELKLFLKLYNFNLEKVIDQEHIFLMVATT